MELNYLKSVRNQFENYKQLGEKTFEQLEEDDFFWQYNNQTNSIAIIVNHLSGNMKSRWTDFLITDGEKEWRNRDSEFDTVLRSKTDVLTKWNEGWNCLFKALDSINTNNFGTSIKIRNEEHSIPEAINRQLAHYSYHVGQLVFIGIMIKGNTWSNLSIPKGTSADFNKVKFAAGKDRANFGGNAL